MDATVAAASSMPVENDDIVVETNQQMAMLLDFQANPTRQNLLAEIIAKGIHREVLPELSKIFDLLEVDFKPLTLPSLIYPIQVALSGHPTLHVYALPLQQVAVLRVIQQMSKVCGTVKIQRVQSILAPFNSLSYTQIEKLMIDSVVKKQLNVRIDHVHQCLRFGSVAAAAQTAESQVVYLGNQLNKTSFQLQTLLKSPAQIEEDVRDRQNYLNSCASSANDNFLKSSEKRIN